MFLFVLPHPRSLRVANPRPYSGVDDSMEP